MVWSLYKMKKPIFTGSPRWPIRTIHLQQAGLLIVKYIMSIKDKLIFFLDFSSLFNDSQLKIIVVLDFENSTIFNFVKTILSYPDSPEVSRLEAEISKLVYDLYGLTPEEIAIVEGRK